MALPPVVWAGGIPHKIKGSITHINQCGQDNRISLDIHDAVLAKDEWNHKAANLDFTLRWVERHDAMVSD